MISYLPTSCLWCDSTKNILKNWGICKKCHEDIFISSFIQYKAEIPFRVTSFESKFHFSGKLRELIIKWKYNPTPELSRPLAASALSTWGLENIDFDLIIPVPPHIDRLRERKIHQTLLIAKQISNWHKVPIFYDIHRTKNTPSQTGLSKWDRAGNLQNSFELKKINKLSGKNLLIIDDVMTTGSTLRSVANLIKESSKSQIHIRALAVN